MNEIKIALFALTIIAVAAMLFLKLDAVAVVTAVIGAIAGFIVPPKKEG